MKALGGIGVQGEEETEKELQEHQEEGETTLGSRKEMPHRRPIGRSDLGGLML